jgi:hypothetical protein
MNKDRQIIEKQNILIQHLMGFVYEGWDGSNPIKYLQTVKCKLCNKFALEISVLESQSEEENYPKEFVEWINWEDENDDFHFIKDYTTNTFLNADENMKAYTIAELFDYWKSNIK